MNSYRINANERQSVLSTGVAREAREQAVWQTTNKRHHQRSDSEQKRVKFCRNQAGKGEKRRFPSRHLVPFTVYTHSGIAIGTADDADAGYISGSPDEQLQFKTHWASSRCCQQLDRHLSSKPATGGEDQEGLGYVGYMARLA